MGLATLGVTPAERLGFPPDLAWAGGEGPPSRVSEVSLVQEVTHLVSHGIGLGLLALASMFLGELLSFCEALPRQEEFVVFM